MYVCGTEAWLQKRKREFAKTTTSRNQYDNSAELSESNKTVQHGCVKTVKGKTKKQRGIRGDKNSGDGGRERDRVSKIEREIPNTNVETQKTEQHMYLEC
jgi:hypothetical protein